MRAGKLRDRLTIQSATVSQDATGDPVSTWATLATVWGSVVPLTGTEPFAAHQFESKVTHEVTIRYRTDVTPAMRIAHGSKTLEVDAVMDPDGRKRSLRILATERV